MCERVDPPREVGVRTKPFLRATSFCESPIYWCSAWVSNILAVLSPPVWYGLFRQREPSMLLMDIYHLGLIVGLAVGLSQTETIPAFGWGIAVFVLVDFAGASLRDLLVSPGLHNGKIKIRIPGRWFIIALLEIGMIVLAFGVLLRLLGHHFTPKVNTGLSAVYLSAVTLSTLGYGDINPAGSQVGQLLVLGELSFFILFIAVKLPVALSLLDVEKS